MHDITLFNDCTSRTGRDEKHILSGKIVFKNQKHLSTKFMSIPQNFANEKQRGNSNNKVFYCSATLI